MDEIVLLLFLILYFGILFSAIYYAIVKTRKIYEATGGKNLQQYTRDELVYRSKIKDYIQNNIDALLWHHSYIKPARIKQKINLDQLPKDVFTIDTGNQDIQYQIRQRNQNAYIYFTILDQTVLVVSDYQKSFTTSDESRIYRKNNRAVARHSYNRNIQNSHYQDLQHDIPTIALVYIEHYIRNCVEERESFYSNYQSIKKNEQIQPIHQVDPFNEWEKEATNHFINKYKDEYGLDASTTNEEEVDIFNSYTDDENQTQNG